MIIMNLLISLCYGILIEIHIPITSAVRFLEPLMAKKNQDCKIDD